MKGLRSLPSHKNEQGAIFIIVAIFVLFAGLGFAAFAITFSRLHVIQNEIQNAADAGAMAGAGDLLNEDGSVNDPGYDTTADGTAKANYSGGDPVEVVSIRRGHWSFATHEFTENNNDQLADLFTYTFAELDGNTGFINAVEVVTQRTSIPSFFARILGHSSFERTAEAVAYIAPPGSFQEYEVDQPIVLCEEAITQDGILDCITGRMINSGQGTGEAFNSGGWTNFNQPARDADNCGGLPNSVPAELFCSGGNPEPINNSLLRVLGGQSAGPTGNLFDCWRGYGDYTNPAQYDSDGDGEPDAALDSDGSYGPDHGWEMTVLVVDCSYPDEGDDWRNVGNCIPVVGAVRIEVLWITDPGGLTYETPENPPAHKPPFSSVPWEMGDVSADDYWGPGPPTSPGYPDINDPAFWPDGEFDEEVFSKALWQGLGNEWTKQDGWDIQDQATLQGSFIGHFGLKNVSGDHAPLLKEAIYIKPSCEWVEPTGGPGGGGGFFNVLSDRPVLVK